MQCMPTVLDVLELSLDAPQSNGQVMVAAPQEKSGANLGMLHSRLMAGKSVPRHIKSGLSGVQERFWGENACGVDTPGAIGARAFAVAIGSALRGHHTVFVAGRSDLSDAGRSRLFHAPIMAQAVRHCHKSVSREPVWAAVGLWIVGGRLDFIWEGVRQWAHHPPWEPSVCELTAEALAPRSPTTGLRLAACVCLTRADGRLLAVSRRRDPALLCFPGGKLNSGETTLLAAVRETKEETGLCVPRESLKLVYQGPCESDRGDPFDHEVFLFAAVWQEAWGEGRPQEAGIVPQWVTWEHFLDHGAMPVFCREALAGWSGERPC